MLVALRFDILQYSGVDQRWGRAKPAIEIRSVIAGSWWRTSNLSGRGFAFRPRGGSASSGSTWRVAAGNRRRFEVG
jgi:hypothetical protein